MVAHVAESPRRVDKTAVLRFAAHGLRLKYGKCTLHACIYAFYLCAYTYIHTYIDIHICSKCTLIKGNK